MSSADRAIREVNAALTFIHHLRDLEHVRGNGGAAHAYTRCLELVERALTTDPDAPKE